MTRLRKAGIGLTAAGLLAVGFIGGWEGMRTTAYLDVVGVPTVCFGETRGVKLGDRYTPDECRAMLGDGLADFERQMQACLPNHAAIPDPAYVASLSLAYNIGAGAFCRSTLAGHLRAGNIRAACDQFPRWNKAGGRVIRGLELRRAAERELCLKAVRS